MSEQKAFVISIGLIAAGIVGVAWAIAYCQVESTRIYVEGGYEPRAVAGSSSLQWVKADKPAERSE